MTRKILLPVLFLTFLFSAVSFGMFVIPTPIPVDRLIKNTTAYINEHPDDINAYYTLGRIHYVAFANKSNLVGANEREALPSISRDWMQQAAVSQNLYNHARELVLKEYGYASDRDVPNDKRAEVSSAVQKKREELEQQKWNPDPLDDDELYEHANEAMKYFNKVIGLDPENGLYYHGLACLIEQYKDYLDETKSQVVPEEFRKVFLEQAKQYYYKAFSLSIIEDSGQSMRPISGLKGFVSYEAGNSYVRLADAETKDKQEQNNLKEVKAGLAKLENVPEGIITPIIFSLKQNQKLNQLLAPNQNVQFDLDGNGLKETWSWIKPETGILVWDPENTGQITSGRQLFGSVSWWMFYEDGYKALNALDDNRDGTLTDSELNGIRVWFDRNSNGTSEKDEVVDLAKLEITAIGTIATGKVSGMPMCETGIKFSDSTIITTYDWTTSPIK
ncbi:MAG: hypothetical protein JXA96_10095 [Sedimentisphaerales bacterium]|nr:hypothetical protein [Sedimentisphaerales bacterium]